MPADALERPKKPYGGAYRVFLDKHRAELQLEYAALRDANKLWHPGGSAFPKMAGRMWGKLSEQEKKPYVEAHEALKEQYEKDRKAFLESRGETEPGDRARAPRSDALERPKRPYCGAFGAFLDKHRAELKLEFVAQREAKRAWRPKSFFQTARRKWGGLSEQEKKPYVEAYEVLKEQYAR
eukprot:CAMPEP_0171209114 /NCGR_PEP_ID=MMETSP0790-20130122/28431_1 /TAXON_ID=2925 /ORGANISM="Alexandrium catenella, Strain OF101" /LENGTH=180 /DNA_ID=CAMNT_0011674719 /DNA_START=1 /DNA_END=540 /DNA_ORIENTATION=-